jgi:hypothetical protein
MERWSGGGRAAVALGTGGRDRGWRRASGRRRKASKRAAAQVEQAGGGASRASGRGRSHAGLDAAGGARVSWRWASQNTNRQMGLAEHKSADGPHTA